MKLPGQPRDARFRRALKWSSIVHGFLLGALLLWPLLHQFLRREKPVEQVTFINLVEPLPPMPEPDVQTPEPEPEPEPEPPPPRPKPKEEVKKPEPPRTNEVKKTTVKVSTKKIRRPTTTPAQQKPPLTPEEIRRLLAAGIPQGGAPATGPVSDMAWYYALVRATMYESWDQPSGLSGAGLVTKVRIRVQRDGTVTARDLIRPSGHSLMDESVMKAVNSVSRLKALPAEYDGYYKDITIDFELTGVVP
jgi:protein TonB